MANPATKPSGDEGDPRIARLVREQLEQIAEARGNKDINLDEVIKTLKENEEKAAKIRAERKPGDDLNVTEIAEIATARALEALAPILRQLSPGDVDDALHPDNPDMAVLHVRALVESESSDAKVIDFQEAVGRLNLARGIYGAMPKNDGMKFPMLQAEVIRTARNAGISMRAFGPGEAGSGDSLVFDAAIEEVIPRVNVIGNIAALFRQLVWPGRRDKLTIFGRGARTQAFITAASADPTTDDAKDRTPITFDAVKLAVLSVVQREAEEDIIVSGLAFTQEELAMGIMRGVEEAIISGDSTGGHIDSDTTDAADRRKAWNGLREIAIARSATKDMNALTLAIDLAELMGLMTGTVEDHYGTDPGQLFVLIPPTRLFKFLKDTDMKTAEVLGSRATIISGMIGSILGMPVLVSSLFRADLNVSGVFDGVTTDNHGVLVVRRDAFALATKRSMEVELDRQIKNDTWDVVARTRVDYRALYGTGEKTVAYGINYDN